MLWLVLCALNVTFRPEYLVGPGGMWIILLFVVCFGLGSVVSKALAINYEYSNTAASIEYFPYLRIITLVLALIGSLAVVLIIVDHFDNIKTLDLSDAIRYVAQTESGRRYHGIKRPMSFSLLNAALFSSTLFGGLLFSEQRPKSKTLAFLPIVIAIIYSIVTTAKAGAIQSGIMWLSAYISGTLYFQDRKNEEREKRNIYLLIGILVLSSIILMLTQPLRYGNSSSFELLWNGFESYILGGLPPFTSWAHSTMLLNLSPDLGKWTFPGLFEVLGIGKRLPGIYGDAFVIGHYNSNLYSAFRGLIQDFTLPGALILTFGLGIVTDRSYRSVQNHRDWSIGILAASYSFLLWSPIISLFVYNAVLIATLLFFSYTLGVAAMHRKNHLSR
jgi:oligosaccharide repeat unit polymerase